MLARARQVHTRLHRCLCVSSYDSDPVLQTGAQEVMCQDTQWQSPDLKTGSKQITPTEVGTGGGVGSWVRSDPLLCSEHPAEQGVSGPCRSLANHFALWRVTKPEGVLSLPPLS